VKKVIFEKEIAVCLCWSLRACLLGNSWCEKAHFRERDSCVFVLVIESVFAGDLLV